jgi:hypothetical protein
VISGPAPKNLPQTDDFDMDLLDEPDEIPSTPKSIPKNLPQNFNFDMDNLDDEPDEISNQPVLVKRPIAPKIQAPRPQLQPQRASAPASQFNYDVDID